MNSTRVYFVYGVAIHRTFDTEGKNETTVDYVNPKGNNGIKLYNIDFENSNNFDGSIVGLELSNLNCHYSGAMELGNLKPTTEQIKALKEYLECEGNEEIKHKIPNVYSILLSERI